MSAAGTDFRNLSCYLCGDVPEAFLDVRISGACPSVCARCRASAERLVSESKREAIAHAAVAAADDPRRGRTILVHVVQDYTDGPVAYFSSRAGARRFRDRLMERDPRFDWTLRIGRLPLDTGRWVRSPVRFRR